MDGQHQQQQEVESQLQATSPGSPSEIVSAGDGRVVAQLKRSSPYNGAGKKTSAEQLMRRYQVLFIEL